MIFGFKVERTKHFKCLDPFHSLKEWERKWTKTNGRSINWKSRGSEGSLWDLVTSLRLTQYSLHAVTTPQISRSNKQIHMNTEASRFAHILMNCPTLGHLLFTNRIYILAAVYVKTWSANITFNNEVSIVGYPRTSIWADDAAVAAGAALRCVTNADSCWKTAVVHHSGHHQRRVFAVPLLQGGKARTVC